jgi:hypothetical protein
MMTPFLCGHGPWLGPMAARVQAAIGTAPVVIDVLQPSSVGFFRRLLAGNAVAFGGMAMPAWVQLDCATLPSVVVGFAMPRDEVSSMLWPAIAAQLAQQSRHEHDDSDNNQAWVPLAQYCAVPTPDPSLWVGFSLYSLVPGYGLRAKALGLLAYGAHQQRGITQTDNTALKTHTRLGPLTIDAVQVQVHSKPATTVVYTLAVPPLATLQAIARGEMVRVATTATTMRIPMSSLRAGHCVVDVDGDQVMVER